MEWRSHHLVFARSILYVVIEEPAESGNPHTGVTTGATEDIWICCALLACVGLV